MELALAVDVHVVILDSPELAEDLFVPAKHQLPVVFPAVDLLIRRRYGILSEFFLQVFQLFTHSLVAINQQLHRLELVGRYFFRGLSDPLCLPGVQILLQATPPAVPLR